LSDSERNLLYSPRIPLFDKKPMHLGHP